MLDAVFGRYGSGLSVSFCVKLHFEKTYEMLKNQIGQSKLAKTNDGLIFKSKQSSKTIVATRIECPLQMVNLNQTV